MKLIDLHCDTLTRVMNHPEDGSLLENRLSVDLTRLGSHDRALQFFACFVHMGSFENQNPDLAYEYTCRVLDYFHQGMESFGDVVMPVRTLADVDRCLGLCCMDPKGTAADTPGDNGVSGAVKAGNPAAGKKVGALLTVEEGAMLGGKMERLEHFFNAGVRLLTLTWNFDNCIGHPNSRDEAKMKLGLTPFGFEVLERMQELGMIVDVSHLSDGGFWDVAYAMKKPFVASHSNARALCAHPRNLTDEMLKKLADCGGVTGLNLCPQFLDEEKGSTVDVMVRHILHIIDVAGEDVMAIGTDFDGIGGPLEIGGTQDMELLAQALETAKVPGRIVDKIFFENAYRVMKEVLPKA